MSVCSTYPITRANVCCSFGKPPTRMSPVMVPAARQCQCTPFSALPHALHQFAAGAERRALTYKCGPLLQGPQARWLGLTALQSTCDTLAMRHQTHSMYGGAFTSLAQRPRLMAAQTSRPPTAAAGARARAAPAHWSCARQ